jgi:hypothetical protein
MDTMLRTQDLKVAIKVHAFALVCEDVVTVECDRRAQQDKTAIMESARDMHLLSLTDINIFSSSSGFGVVSAMMRPK